MLIVRLSHPLSPPDVTVAPIRGSGKDQWETRKICVSQPRSNFWQPPSYEGDSDNQTVSLHLLFKSVATINHRLVYLAVVEF